MPDLLPGIKGFVWQDLPESENIEDRRGADPSREVGRKERYLRALISQANAADARNIPASPFESVWPPPPFQGAPMNLSNPMIPFQMPTDQAFALQQLISLLGGLGNAPTAAGPVAPNLMNPKQVQPKDASLDPILGGLSMTDSQQPNPMKKPSGRAY